jgi:preprotein translocase subunit SecE
VKRVARKVIDEPSEDLVANAKRDRADRRGPFARIALFVRQVITELRKVVAPTRRELFGYTAVVLVFVLVMMALVYGLDFGFGWLVSWVFGNGSASGT